MIATDEAFMSIGKKKKSAGGRCLSCSHGDTGAKTTHCVIKRAWLWITTHPELSRRSRLLWSATVSWFSYKTPVENFFHKPLKPTIEGREQTSHWELRLAPLAVSSKLVLSGFWSVGYFCSFAAKLSVLMTSDSPRGQVSIFLYSAEVSCLND